MLPPVLAALAGYLLGGIPFGFLIAKAKGIDIREHGSGNIGATNVARALGAKFFPVVFLLDFAKGCGPVLLASYLMGNAEELSWLEAGATGDLMLIAGIGAFVGHTFPIYLRFKGGKGVATGLGVLTGILPVLGGLCLGVFLVVFLISRYVSLSSMAGALAAPTTFYLWHGEGTFSEPYLPARFAVLVGLALLIIYLHRANIALLLAGNERRVALFKTTPKNADEPSEIQA